MCHWHGASSDLPQSSDVPQCSVSPRMVTICQTRVSSMRTMRILEHSPKANSGPIRNTPWLKKMKKKKKKKKKRVHYKWYLVIFFASKRTNRVCLFECLWVLAPSRLPARHNTGKVTMHPEWCIKYNCDICCKCIIGMGRRMNLLSAV